MLRYVTAFSALYWEIGWPHVYCSPRLTTVITKLKLIIEVRMIPRGIDRPFWVHSNSSTTLSTRPIRAAVANAVAISEAASGSGEGGGAATGNGDKPQAKRRGRKPGMGFPTSKNLDLKKKKKKGLVARKLGKGAAIVADKASGNKGKTYHIRMHVFRMRHF